MLLNFIGIKTAFIRLSSSPLPWYPQDNHYKAQNELFSSAETMIKGTVCINVLRREFLCQAGPVKAT